MVTVTCIRRKTRSLFKLWLLLIDDSSFSILNLLLFLFKWQTQLHWKRNYNSIYINTHILAERSMNCSLKPSSKSTGNPKSFLSTRDCVNCIPHIVHIITWNVNEEQNRLRSVLFNVQRFLIVVCLCLSLNVLNSDTARALILKLAKLSKINHANKSAEGSRGQHPPEIMSTSDYNTKSSSIVASATLWKAQTVKEGWQEENKTLSR